MLDATQRNYTKWSVKFPTALLTDPYAVGRAKVIQAPGSHDIAILTMTSGTKYDGLLDGAPVTLSWSNPRGSGGFSGYVHRVDPDYTPGAYAMTLICVGASYPLMTHGVDVWTDVKANEVVRDIARRFGLAYDVEDHPRVYGQVAQAGDSYWKLLNRLARETGYVLRMEGATLVFRSRQSLTSHYRAISPALDFVASVNPQLKMLGEVMEFRPKVGQYTPELGATRAMRTSYGVSPTNNATVSATASLETLSAAMDPLFEEILSQHVVHTDVEATTAVESENERNRFSRLATMKTLGDPYLAPERMVYVRGVSGDFNGYWTVRKVEHDITARDYHCTVEVGTDGLGGAVTLPGENLYAPAPSSSVALVNPHRPGALTSWPYPDPVLRSSTSITGSAGTPLTDFYWTAPAVDWSAS